jgi:signal transduction histidine kinase
MGPVATESGGNRNERILMAFANEGEKIVSFGRLLLCGSSVLMLLGGARTSGVAGRARLFIIVPLLMILCAASALTIRAARRGLLRSSHLAAWAISDAIATLFVLLATNVLVPPALHAGFTYGPAIAELCVVLAANAFRLSPRISVAASAIHFASGALLIRLDYTLNGLSNLRAALHCMIAVACAAFFACWGAVGARRIAERVYAEATRALRAKNHVGIILRQHHDLRTVLSSARLNAEMLAAEYPSERAKKLIRSMSEFSEFVETVKTQSLSELALLDGAGQVDVTSVLVHAVDAARHRFHETKIDFAAIPSSHAVVVGGADAFARCALNIIVNACEGDGARYASSVRVVCERDGSRIRFQVEDDGPGFVDRAMTDATAELHTTLTTKDGGTGLGLLFARNIVEASGGQMMLSNAATGGASVTCWFQAIDAPTNFGIASA